MQVRYKCFPFYSYYGDWDKIIEDALNFCNMMGAENIISINDDCQQISNGFQTRNQGKIQIWYRENKE